MKTILALIIVSTLTACLDVGDNTEVNTVEQVCGLPPNGTAYSAEYTHDSDGSEIVIIPRKQFDDHEAWVMKLTVWADCALSAK